MSSPANLPALQAVTPNGIHAYLTQAADEIRIAASQASLGTLTDCAQRVTAIYQSVTRELATKPAKPNGGFSSRTLEQIAQVASGISIKPGEPKRAPLKIASGEAFNYPALKAEVDSAHEAALMLFAQFASGQAEAPTPEPFDLTGDAEQQQQPALLTFGQPLQGFDTALVNPFTPPGFTLVPSDQPFVFTAGTDSPLSVVHEEQAAAAEQSGPTVPPLDLSALVKVDDAVQGPDSQRSNTPKSEAPSENDDESAANTLVATDGKANAGQPDDVNVEDSEQSGDELDELDKNQPTDIPVPKDEEETSSNCRPGRKTACAAVTAALGGVGFYFKGAIVQAGSTVVAAATTHGSALWNGVKGAVLTGGYKALEQTLEQCESDEDVTPGLPGVKPKHVVAASVTLAAATALTLGYILTRKAKTE